VQRPSKSRGPKAIAAAALGLALVGGAAGGAVGYQLADKPAPTAAATSSGSGSASRLSVTNGTNLADVVATLSPSVVTVLVTENGQSAEGSGLVLSADGLILTNNHVAGGATSMQVRLSDGRTVPATTVSLDAADDLALIRAQGVSGLTAAGLGANSDLQVGDTVLAFGSPLGLEGSVTAGIVSALNRDVSSGSGGSRQASNDLTHLIQTDAAINPGNSGGPLVNTAGKVVGINVANATTGQDSGSIGVGFAIPVDTAKAFIAKAGVA
jgi:putative serine protease PepD